MIIQSKPAYLNQLCPVCCKPMISLAGYVNEGSCDDHDPADDNFWGCGGYDEPGAGFVLFDYLFTYLGRMFRVARLRPIARRYPNSLYCTRCGRVQRRL